MWAMNMSSQTENERAGHLKRVKCVYTAVANRIQTMLDKCTAALTSAWCRIVSNINRAVNDKTAKDMLSAQFRSQLLMDGSYGKLAFVATQSDVLQPSEIRRSLGLAKNATIAGASHSHKHCSSFVGDIGCCRVRYSKKCLYK